MTGSARGQARNFENVKVRWNKQTRIGKSSAQLISACALRAPKFTTGLWRSDTFSCQKSARSHSAVKAVIAATSESSPPGWSRTKLEVLSVLSGREQAREGGSQAVGGDQDVYVWRSGMCLRCGVDKHRQLAERQSPYLWASCTKGTGQCLSRCQHKAWPERCSPAVIARVQCATACFLRRFWLSKKCTTVSRRYNQHICSRKEPGWVQVCLQS